MRRGSQRCEERESVRRSATLRSLPRFVARTTCGDIISALRIRPDAPWNLKTFKSRKSKELADHLAAHKVHSELLDQDMKSSTCDVDITAQVVEMARSGGSGLPGNRSRVGEGDAVFVRWSDGHWYPAHVSSCEQRAYKVSWDPPYQRWASEEVPEQSVIPRMNQPREVCNFDVALEFVKRLQASTHGRSEPL